jgi:hypothetical protein
VGVADEFGHVQHHHEAPDDMTWGPKRIAHSPRQTAARRDIRPEDTTFPAPRMVGTKAALVLLCGGRPPVEPALRTGLVIPT